MPLPSNSNTHPCTLGKLSQGPRKYSTINNNKIHSVYAYLCVKSVDAAIEFYSKAFGAVEQFRLVGPDGQVGHAEISLGDSILMLAEEFPEMGIVAPEPNADASLSIHLHVQDANAMFEAAVVVGATVEQAMQDQFYGERSGTLRDPFGYRWLLGHSIEDVSTEEMQARYTKLFEEG